MLRAIRKDPQSALSDPSLMEAYQNWANSAQTKLFIELALNASSGSSVNTNVDTAGQDAIATVSRLVGMNTLATVLLNLDDSVQDNANNELESWAND